MSAVTGSASCKGARPLGGDASDSHGPAFSCQTSSNPSFPVDSASLSSYYHHAKASRVSCTLPDSPSSAPAEREAASSCCSLGERYHMLSLSVCECGLQRYEEIRGQRGLLAAKTRRDQTTVTYYTLACTATITTRCDAVLRLCTTWSLHHRSCCTPQESQARLHKLYINVSHSALMEY